MANHEKIFVGVDEAGYGPNLGPLVIAATIWKTRKELSEANVTTEFAKFSDSRPWTPGCNHLPLGDSKKLFQPAGGLISLETGLLAILSDSESHDQNLGEFIARHARFISVGSQATLPWYESLHRLGIPCQADPNEIQRLGKLSRQALTSSEVEFIGAKALIVGESAFNQGVLQLGSKGQVLSQQTLGLVADIVSEVTLDAEVYCDRQGGRKNYLPVLLHAMPEEWFDETSISSQRSSYRNRGSRLLETHFTVKGDSFPPTALASMLAKYLRECLMQLFNAFWKGHLPDLKSTAGYPVDAQRFRAEIEELADRLHLQESQWWRCR